MRQRANALTAAVFVASCWLTLQPAAAQGPADTQGGTKVAEPRRLPNGRPDMQGLWIKSSGGQQPSPRELLGVGWRLAWPLGRRHAGRGREQLQRENVAGHVGEFR